VSDELRELIDKEKKEGLTESESARAKELATAQIRQSHPAHGRVIIAVQDALSRGDFRSEGERDQFCTYLAGSMAEKLRQQLLTWRANELDGADLAISEAKDRARRKASL